MIAALEMDKPSEAASQPGGEEVLRELVDRHSGVVKAVLRKRYAGALGADDIDDVVATATHKLWRKVESLPGIASPRAWFLRIADNVARDVLRFGWQKARQLEVSADSAWLGSFPEPPRVMDEPEPTVDPNLRSALREIVAALPEKQRRIVWADALNPDGPVASDLLAEELGIPSGTVRVYRKRGLDRIRREIEKRNLSPE